MSLPRPNATVNLAGKVAAVTGGSRGIGQAVAWALADAGADVASLHLPDDHQATVTADGLAQRGRRSLMFEGTTADSQTVDDFTQSVEAELGPIDIWVNNAAAIMVKPFLSTSEKDWDRLLGSNLLGYVNGCRAALRVMAPRRSGKIINISSITAHQVITDMSAYVTAKGGVVALTRALALEFGPLGINVNAVAPGAIATPLNAELYTVDVRAVYEDRIAVGRIGVPSDIAGGVVFLASDAASYICGHELVIDGGMTINGNVGFEAEN